jgi:hypothetical protein
MRRAVQVMPDNSELLAYLAYAYAGGGRPKEARAIVARLKDAPSRARNALYIGLAHAALGESDSAFHWLGQTEPNIRFPIFGAADPRLASLRSDPRYPEWLKTMSLPLNQPAR